MSFYTYSRSDFLFKKWAWLTFLCPFKDLKLQWIGGRGTGNCSYLNTKCCLSLEFTKLRFLPHPPNTFFLSTTWQELIYSLSKVDLCLSSKKISKRVLKEASDEIEKCLLLPLVINQTDVKDANSPFQHSLLRY